MKRHYHNGIKTFWLLCLMWAILIAFGYVLARASGYFIFMPLFALIAVGQTAYSYWNSDKLAIRSMDAYEVTPQQAPELYEIVQELSSIAGQPMPRIYIAPTMSPNAFATGRNPQHAAVCCTEGILNLLDRRELRGVLGHELSHALAKHANERISNQLLLQAGGQILGAAVNTRSQLLGGLINQAYGLGAQVGVMLPFGRKQEYEADKMGLVLMAMAGYDPRYAVNFWQKMSASKGGAQQNELLSTHPSDANRIKEIQAYLPNALKYYQGGNSTQSTTTTPPPTGRSTKSSRTIRANEVGNYLRK